MKPGNSRCRVKSQVVGRSLRGYSAFTTESKTHIIRIPHFEMLAWKPIRLMNANVIKPMGKEASTISNRILRYYMYMSRVLPTIVTVVDE